MALNVSIPIVFFHHIIPPKPLHKIPKLPRIKTLPALSRLQRTGPAVIVRLANRRGLIPPALQLLHNRRPCGLERAIINRIPAISRNIGRKPQLMRISPRNHRSPARHTNRTLRPRPLKTHAPIRQSIQIRRLHQRISGTAEHIVAVLIAKNEQNIGLLFHRPSLPHTGICLPEIARPIFA